MLVVHSIDQLITVRGRNALRQGQEMNDVEIIENGYLVVENGKFIALGAGDGYLEYQKTELYRLSLQRALRFLPVMSLPVFNNGRDCKCLLMH